VKGVVTSVLVVEDHDDARQVLGEFLTLAGFAVRTASNGIEALRILDQEGLPDLIVLDLMLPWVNGVEVLAAIRQHPQRTRIPVLVTTATGTTEFDLRAYKPLKLLRKPFNYDALVPTLQALLVEARFA